MTALVKNSYYLQNDNNTGQKLLVYTGKKVLVAVVLLGKRLRISHLPTDFSELDRELARL